MRYWVVFSLLLGCMAIAEFCTAPSENKDLNAGQPTGKELAAIYCQGCHEVPNPALLDKKTWKEHVLPRMGYFYGHYRYPQERLGLIEEGPGGDKVEKAKVFPESPTLDSSIWMKIQAYYLAMAPDSLEQPKLPEIEQGLPHFTVRKPALKLSPPSTTMVRFSNRSFYVGDAFSKKLYRFDDQLQLTSAARVEEGAVWMQETPANIFLTVMGSFSPTDAPNGFLMQLPKNQQQSPRVIIPNLQRPVHSSFADFNQDGLGDAVICEFAKWTGSLSWWEQQEDETFEKNLLRDEPGAIKAYPHDLNGDGKTDIAALFGQGHEGIFFFYNQGNGQFKEEKVINIPSTYGSSFFKLFDYNGDAHPDILYTAGDNADYPPILKPYHGIRIFQNNGQNQFEEVFFFPLYGAYGAIPADFDQDGDMDIAAISFFPDFVHRPEGGFVYLQNDGKGNFHPYTFPDVSDGRWIVMDSGDLDQDGDLDLLLGALTFEVIPKIGLVNKWVEGALPFIYLENTTY